MDLGFVVIGRNEGDRLVACLSSIAEADCPIVYVDSGSTDQSVVNARRSGAMIVELDLSKGFTAARARNAGFDALVAANPDLGLVHFMDGDCTLAPDWLNEAVAFMAARSDVAVVCGRRQEQFPDASVYNWLCEREWNRPPGKISACGGDALMRIGAFRQVGRFRDDLIAGEEPELCVRLRQSGWLIWRLDMVMTRHDASMSRFAQWWRRMIRGGHAYAEISSLHSAAEHGIWFRETARALFWGLFLPLAIIAGGLINVWLFAGLLLYPVQIARIAGREKWRTSDSWRFALFMVLAKFAEAYGIVRFYILRSLQTRSKIIEYK